jgi:hypothetical protein
MQRGLGIAAGDCSGSEFEDELRAVNDEGL